MNAFKRIYPLLAALLLIGCATPGESVKMRDAGQAQAQENGGLIQRNMADMEDRLRRNRHRSDVPWIGGTVLEKPKNELPPAFLAKVTLALSERQIPLSVAASEITRVTGIPVRISSDVEVLSQQSSAPAASTAPTTATAVAAEPSYYPAWGTTVDLDFENVSLTDILDQISARMGISWEYRHRDGAIYFSRYVTRTFSVNILPGQTKQNASVGKSGGDSGFSATASSSVDSNMDTWSTIEAEIKAMMTEKGKIAVSPSTKTLTVTDVRDTMEKVEQYVVRLNKSMTSQIYFKIDIVNVSLGRGSEFGVNWNFVKQTLMQSSQNYQINLATMAATGAGSGSSLGLSVLSALDGSPNPYAGSQALLSALQSVGNTSVVDSRRIVSLNNQPTPVAVTTQTSYIQSVTPGVAATASTPATPAVPAVATMTTGYLLNIYPSLLDQSELILQISVDISELSRMKLVPSGINGISIEQPEIASTQFLQRAKVRVGDTVVLSGYARNRYQTTEQGALHAEQPGLGGGFNGVNSKDELIILVTPVLAD